LPKLWLAGSLDPGTKQKGEWDRATGATLQLFDRRIWNQGNAAALCRDAATEFWRHGVRVWVGTFAIYAQPGH
jgi:hypothetical protein